MWQRIYKFKVKPYKSVLTLLACKIHQNFKQTPILPRLRQRVLIFNTHDLFTRLLKQTCHLMGLSVRSFGATPQIPYFQKLCQILVPTKKWLFNSNKKYKLWFSQIEIIALSHFCLSQYKYLHIFRPTYSETVSPNSFWG